MGMRLGDLAATVQQAFKDRVREGKFTDDDVRDDPALYDAACTYAEQYTGENPFLRDVQHNAVTGGAWLTTAQARGVLNTMLHGLRSAARAKAQGSHSQPQRKRGENQALSESAAIHTGGGATAVARQLRAAETAKAQRVRIMRVEGREGIYRTRSKSDPSVHYMLAVLPDGRVACSCEGYKHTGICKHEEALVSKLARENNRKS